jgi:hypothetical protein
VIFVTFFPRHFEYKQHILSWFSHQLKLARTLTQSSIAGMSNSKYSWLSQFILIFSSFFDLIQSKNCKFVKILSIHFAFLSIKNPKKSLRAEKTNKWAAFGPRAASLTCLIYYVVLSFLKSILYTAQSLPNHLCFTVITELNSESVDSHLLLL